MSNYGMTEAQEEFLKQVLLAVRDSREVGSKVNAEDIINRILDRVFEE